MVALPISLGLNHSLREEDLFRALFCSVAVYSDNAEAQNFFQQTLVHFPHITFDKVDMALDVPDGQKILVAYSGNDAFIAFKGTESFADVASDIMVNNQSKFGGSFHKGFFDRSCIFMASNRSDFNPLPGLLLSGKRVIFCGHSLGGAVAHMVLLRFWLEGGELPSRDTYADSLFSIAFGAPHICNDKAAGIINNNENLRWRFINFVNQNDPVPVMLHRIRRTISAGLRGSFAEADSVLQVMGGFLGCAIKGSRLNSAIREGRLVARKALVTAVQQNVILPLIDALGASVASNSNSSEVPEKPDFYPIGQYISLVQEAGDWRVDRYFGHGLNLQTFLDKDLKFTVENLEQHCIGSYKSSLTAIYGSSARGVVISSTPHQSPHLQVRTPAPKVTFAKWIIEDSVPQYIQVRGENLLFLREAVSIDGLEHWKIVFRGQSDKELMLCRPSTPGRRDSSQQTNFLEKSVFHVIVKTAFGQTHHPILEDCPNSTTDIGVSRMISKIVQALNVKATPSLSIRPTDKVLRSLDDIMRCIPKVKGKKISTELLKLTRCDNDLNGRSVENHCKEINHMLDLVRNYLKSSLKVEYFESEGLGNIHRRAHSLLVESGLARAGIIVGTAAILPVDLASGIPIGTAVLVASFAGYLILSPKESIFTEYEDVLKCAIEETSKWSELDRTGENTNSGRNLEDLEKELIEQETHTICSPDFFERCSLQDDRSYTFALGLVLLEALTLNENIEKSTRTFKKMVKEAHSTSISTVPSLKSDLFRGATPESRLKLLKRIKLVYDTSYLYNLEVAGVHFIGVFGAEDAGKSTFIKKVLKKQFPLDEHLQVPEAGFDSHTKIVRTYKLNDSLWLVDFPGSDGAGPYADKWKQFTSLSSSSVLFLNFDYDVKDEQVKMYQEMKEKLGAQTVVTIVFNKVDERFTPRKQEQFSAEYFTDLKKNTETKLGCTGCQDAVHFACVEPDIPIPDLTKLKGMGVLGFEELHNHLVARLMTESSISR